MRGRLDKFESYLIIAGALWGTSFVAVKIGLSSIDPFFFALLRFALASLVIVPATLLLRQWDGGIFGDRLLVLNSFLSATAFVFQNVGLTMTTATNSALLVNINVGLVAVLAAIILGERLTRSIIVGLFIGLLGVVTISTNGDLSAIYSGSFLGNVMVFTAGTIWAFAIVFQKKLLTRRPNVSMVTAATMVETTLFLVPMTLLFATDYTMDLLGWEATIYVGVMCTGLAYLTYNAGLRGVKASVSSIILLLEIVFAMVFAMLLLSEIPTLITAIGGALIVISIAIISLSNSRANGKPK